MLGSMLQPPIESGLCTKNNFLVSKAKKNASENRHQQLSWSHLVSTLAAVLYLFINVLHVSLNLKIAAQIIIMQHNHYVQKGLL